MANTFLQVPALSIFESSLRRGKFDANRKLSNGSLLEFTNIYPMDAVYDTPEDVPEDVGLTPPFMQTLLPCSHNLPHQFVYNACCVLVKQA